MKCEHGQNITKFCISDNCNSKTAAACVYCLKKNHIHPGHLQTLNFNQFDELIAFLTIQKDKKLKQNSLKQLLINYFQSFKIQVTKSLDTVCKDMIDRLSHPLLYSQNLLEAYKKAKLKQYNKLSTLQLRQLHKLKQKNPCNLQKEQEKLYQSQVAKIKQTIESIKKLFSSYQQVIQHFDKHFSPDSFFYKRIIELTQKIHVENPEHQTKIINQIPIKIKITQHVKINPESEHHNKIYLEPKCQHPILLSLEEYKNMKSSSSVRSNEALNPHTLKVKNQQKQRKLSIALESQNSETYRNFKDHQRNQNPNNIRQTESNHQNLRVQCDSELNFRKNSDPIRLNVITPKLSHSPSFDSSNFTIQEHFNCKQCNSFEFDGSPNQLKKPLLDNKNIKYPPSNDHNIDQPFQHREDIEKKVVKLQMKTLNLTNPDQVESPLLKKKIQSKEKEKIKLLKIENHLNKEQTLLPRNLSLKQDIVLTDNQLKSLALLIESIKMPPQKAIKYLRKSFQFCQQNLSTAEYLSYLLIENNHPKQCLQLCNLMIAKIFTHTQNIEFSVHILNNKAAALNQLGRFSQSIQFLERIVERVQKANLYKNLADAYCALGIYEKSILNYQKCISLNRQYDEAYYNLAVCFYSQQHYEEALTMVSEAIRLNSDRDEYIQLYRNTKPKLFQISSIVK